MEGFGKKSVDNLNTAIEKSRKISLDKFLYAIGIPEVGEGTAKLLARRFKNFDTLRMATIEELQEIDGIGNVMAIEIVKFFKNERNNKIINNLLREVQILNPVQQISNHELSSKKIVLTGALSKPRDEIKKLLESFGALVQGSVSSKTDIVIAGENAGSKLIEAKKLGITIWSESDLEKKVANLNNLL